MKVIRVTGKGNISVSPDTIVLNMSFSQIHPNYESTLKHAAEQSKTLSYALQEVGFAREDLKTTDFYVKPEYERYKDEHDEYKDRLIGYRSTHAGKITFPNDNKKLGEVLYALAHCSAQPHFSFDYTVSDPEKLKNQLLANAIQDAQNKALILTQAAGAQLGELLSINYSWADIHISSHPLHDLCYSMPTENASRSYDIDIEAEDIELDDTVTVEWAIA